jgi:predicted Zn-ribbon and HTH transcriptional regulator
VKEIYDLTKPRRINRDAALPHWEWVMEQVRQGLWDAKKRAKAKQLPFEIEEDDLLKQVEKNRLRCALSAIPFRPCEDYYRNPYRPSIDRIDCKMGYTKKNVRVVAYCVNAAMNEWGESVLEEVARGINGAWKFTKPVLRREPSHICRACGYEFVPVNKQNHRCRWCEIEWEVKGQRSVERGRWSSLATNAEYFMEQLAKTLRATSI